MPAFAAPLVYLTRGLNHSWTHSLADYYDYDDYSLTRVSCLVLGMQERGLSRAALLSPAAVRVARSSLYAPRRSCTSTPTGRR